MSGFGECSVLDQVASPERGIRPRKSVRIIDAASLSTASRKALPSRPVLHKRPLASYVVARSSCRTTGTLIDNDSFRAISRASRLISLSVPSKLYGKPTTRATASNSARVSFICTSSFFQEVLCIAGSGRETIRHSSQTATPTRFVPGSRATTRPVSGTPEISVRSGELRVSFCCTQVFVIG